MTLNTPTQGTVSYHKANTSHGQPVYNNLKSLALAVPEIFYTEQRRRHGFKSGGTKRDSRAKRAKKNFLYPPPIFGKVGVQLFTRGGYEQENKYHY